MNSGIGTDAASTPVGRLTAIPWTVPGADPVGVQPVVALAAGQSDVEPWADNQEVTIDRIVGDINLRGAAFQRYDGDVDVPLAPSVYIRLGLLVQEEGDATSAPFINLFSDEHLEDFEWMWLYSTPPLEWNYLQQRDVDVGTNQGFGFQFGFHIDTHLRRKLGQTDMLWLYASYGWLGDATALSTDIAIQGEHLLRSIFMSK